MPTYEFRCNDTGKPFEVFFKTIADYEQAHITSPYTGSANVSRRIRQVALRRNRGLAVLMAGDESPLTSDDPRHLGRELRQMAAETGEDMGAEFHEIVDRLEAGQSPKEIEATLNPDD